MMAKYFLVSLLQLLSGISIPLHTICYGRMVVPIVLRYQTENDSTSWAVAPGWTLRIGEDAVVEDDAGNRIEVSDEGVFWPRGSVNCSLVDGLVKGFKVLDADSTAVYQVDFETEGVLHAVRVSKGDTTMVHEFVMDYSGDSLLCNVSRSDGGSVEFSFAPCWGRMMKRSVCRKDTDGRLTGASEYTFGSDSICQYVTETVTDGNSVSRKVIRGFMDGLLREKEEYDGEGHLKRCTSYHYTDEGDDARLECVSVTVHPVDSLALPYTVVHNYQYAVGQPYPYPVTVETTDSDGFSERQAYTYPFCPGPSYGPVADSLLHRGMAAAVLSVSRWKDGGFVDSTTVVYSGFQAANAPSGKMFRPSAIIYGDSETEGDTCLKYASYDTLGLQKSRATFLRKRILHKLPQEVFRWMVSDPLDNLMREQRAFDVCAARSETTPDWEFGGSYLFESSGAYLGKVEAGEPAGRVIADLGFGETPLSACFADLDFTPEHIDGHTTLEIVSEEASEIRLAKAGAFDEDHRGFFRGLRFLWRESRYGRRLDFVANYAYDICPNVLYVTKAGPYGAIVHDNYNFGNFLWGATASEVGVPQWIAVLGSHLYNFFSPYSFGGFDSPDDVFSIRTGYHWDGN